MRIISRRRIRDWSATYPDAKQALLRWYDITADAEWDDIQELRRTFPSADAVIVGSERIATVFNIRGNNYRLITAIHYNTERVYVLRFLTHRDYDQGDWKDKL